MKLITSGPTPSRLMFIGEKVGYWEMEHGRPMVGQAGKEFDAMLAEAGINRSEVFVTNVSHEPFNDIPGQIENGFYKIGVGKKLGRERIRGKYPIDEVLRGMEVLPELINQANPDIIIICGAIPLWVLLSLDGIQKWRGSILEYEGRKAIPTYNPAAIIRGNWGWRWNIVQDFRRVAYELRRPEPRRIYYPPRNYTIRPTLDQALSALDSARGQEITNDLETRGGQISCVGIGFDKNTAISIPFMTVHGDGSYWSPEDEVTIILKMREVMTDPSTRNVFHNGEFDCQWYAHQLGFVPHTTDDTMIMQHCTFPGARMALDYCASMYCEYYKFWKDEGREWDPRIHSEDQHWTYSCDDCCYTFEVLEELRKVVASYGLVEQYRFQMSLFYPVLRMMLRGIRVDLEYRNKLNGLLLQKLMEVGEWFEQALGHPLNPDDNHVNGQMRKLFYHDLGLKPVTHRKTKRPTLDKDALEVLRQRHPLLKPLIDKIEEWRSYRVFRSNFVIKEIEPDDRMRSSIMIPGTESFRFASKENIWDRGANLQTIPKGTERD